MSAAGNIKFCPNRLKARHADFAAVQEQLQDTAKSLGNRTALYKDSFESELKELLSKIEEDIPRIRSAYYLSLEFLNKKNKTEQEIERLAGWKQRIDNWLSEFTQFEAEWKMAQEELAPAREDNAEDPYFPILPAHVVGIDQMDSEARARLAAARKSLNGFLQKIKKAK